MSTEGTAPTLEPKSSEKEAAPLDELTPIAEYMALELNTNAHGPIARRLRSLNSGSITECIERQLQVRSTLLRLRALESDLCGRIEGNSRAAALWLWTEKVMNNADWDHKPKIRLRFKSPTTGTGVYHAYGSYKYFYDVWSNIHYGYVGRAAGFGESMLLDGAGLEQLVTDLVRDGRTYSSPNVAGLRKFDDASDRVAIAIGVELYRVKPARVTPADLMREVLKSPDLTKKPL